MTMIGITTCVQYISALLSYTRLICARMWRARRNPTTAESEKVVGCANTRPMCTDQSDRYTVPVVGDTRICLRNDAYPAKALRLVAWLQMVHASMCLMPGYCMYILHLKYLSLQTSLVTPLMNIPCYDRFSCEIAWSE